MRVGFIGLGNVGGKLAGSVLRNGYNLTVLDLDESVVATFAAQGAKSAATPRELASECDAIITCLPSPAASRAVMEGADGILAALCPGKIWMEMSTTDEAEVRALG